MVCHRPVSPDGPAAASQGDPIMTGFDGQTFEFTGEVIPPTASWPYTHPASENCWVHHHCCLTGTAVPQAMLELFA